jgi:tight adherence protein B
MTALLVSLAFGVGCASLLSAFTGSVGSAERTRAWTRLDRLIAASGSPRVTPAMVVWATVVCGVVTGLLSVAVGGSVVVAVAFGAIATTLPTVLLRRRALRRRVVLRAVWPDVVDDLASGVRAGLSLPDVLGRIGERGHPAIAPAFAAFTIDHRTVGSFGVALDALKLRLADPVADRIIESLRLAREVGGADLGRLLRTLSVFLRDDARLRAELEVRQGWTVNAARLAAAAPWVTLAFLSMRPDAVAAYDTGAGVVVLLGGAVVTVVAYRLMIRLGRLPDDPRVLA